MSVLAQNVSMNHGVVSHEMFVGGKIPLNPHSVTISHGGILRIQFYQLCHVTLNISKKNIFGTKYRRIIGDICILWHHR